MAKRAAQGSGTIRKKTITKNGKQYTYWEGRITTGRDPGTGKQMQKSFTGKTQKEVIEKLQSVSVSVNSGTYIPPEKMTFSSWLKIWESDYMGNLKPTTARIYKSVIENHIKKKLGAVRLHELRPHMIQSFINSLRGLSSSSVRMVYSVLHATLEKAAQLEYIQKNPASDCILPKIEREEIHPLSDSQVCDLLRAANGTEIEYMVKIALFTGLRISELLGLSWDCIDFENGRISVIKQLSPSPQRKETMFLSPKSGKSRTLSLAPSVLHFFKMQKKKQSETQLKHGPIFCNEYNLVFTLEDGSAYCQERVTRRFHDILKKAGIQGARFHDLRHTYAVNSIRAGDDIKTIQENLGHSSAAFTLDRYAHYTERMKKDSADRMETFMVSVLNL